jgi:hypothetical protein
MKTKISILVLGILTSILTSAVPASASYIKDYGGDEVYICADKNWIIRNVNFSDSRKRLTKNQCMKVYIEYVDAANRIIEYHENNSEKYIKVYSIKSGTFKYLKVNDAEVIMIDKTINDYRYNR